MIVAVFRSRVAPVFAGEFEALYAEMATHIARVPGYLGHKRFSAPDGEACVIVEFDSEDALEAWDHHPDHQRAKERGKLDVFVAYDVKVATTFEHHHKP